MTKFYNEIKLVPSTPKTYEVSYLETNQEVKKSPLSASARSKIINRSGSNYLSENQEGYGPCKNTLCGCWCSSNECICPSIEVQSDYGNDLKGNPLSASGKVTNSKASGQVSSSAFRLNYSDGDIKLLTSTVGGKIDTSGIGIKASTDVYNIKSNGVQARVGISADTGISTDKGLEVKVLGTGFSVSKDHIGISLPFGELKFNC